MTEAVSSLIIDRSEVGLFRFMQDYDNPRMSMSFCHSKGLLNAPGQNNCFLNSAVQVFWHLDVFRRNFRHLSGHACMGNSCIFCALKAIFAQFQYSDKSALPPDTLRRALAHTFADQQRFQLGYMDDAAECFENILLRIHTHIAPDEKEDLCRAEHCIPHQKFSMAITEKVNCQCGATSEPFSYNEMVFYVSTSALVDEAKRAYKLSHGSWGNFAKLLKDTVATGDVRNCPGNCGAKCDKKRILTNCPDVVSIGLVWDSAKSGAEHIQDAVSCIGTTLNLPELFHSMGVQQSEKSAGVLNLVGVVCYYGKHYSTFFFHSKVEEWIYFDDASVKQISPSWEDVVDRIVRGRHQPLLLLYMNPQSKLVSTDSAPQCTTMVPGYEWKEADADVPTTAVAAAAKGLADSPTGPAVLPPPPPGFDCVDGVGGGRATALPASARAPTEHLEKTVLQRRISGGGEARYGGSSDVSRGGGVSAEWIQKTRAAAAAWSLANPHDDRDSGADEGNGTDYDRQSSVLSTDTASSYSSRASMSSSSYAGDQDACHSNPNQGRVHPTRAPVDSPAKTGRENSVQPALREKLEKTRLRKKKTRGTASNSVTTASRCLSSISLTSADSNESDRRTGAARFGQPSGGVDSSSSNPPGYATLPRKKKVTSESAAAATEGLSQHVDWMKVAAKKGEQLAKGDGGGKEVDVRSRVRCFNQLNIFAADDAEPAAADGGAVAMAMKEVYIKPALLYGAPLPADKVPAADSSYINRTSVEWIIRQQQKATSKSTPGCARGAIKPSVEDMAAAADTWSDHLVLEAAASARLTAVSADSVSLNSQKDSGYRSSGGDCNSTSAGSVSSFSAESPTHAGCAAFEFEAGVWRGRDRREALGEGSGVAAYAARPAANNGHWAGNERFSAEAAQRDDDEDFPPPPSEQELRRIGGGWHAKQASQGSVSSETSTLRNSSTARRDDSSADDESVEESAGGVKRSRSSPNLLLASTQLVAELRTVSAAFEGAVPPPSDIVVHRANDLVMQLKKPACNDTAPSAPGRSATVIAAKNDDWRLETARQIVHDVCTARWQAPTAVVTQLQLISQDIGGGQRQVNSQDIGGQRQLSGQDVVGQQLRQLSPQDVGGGLRQLSSHDSDVLQQQQLVNQDAAGQQLQRYRTDVMTSIPGQRESSVSSRPAAPGSQMQAVSAPYNPSEAWKEPRSPSRPAAGHASVASSSSEPGREAPCSSRLVTDAGVTQACVPRHVAGGMGFQSSSYRGCSDAELGVMSVVSGLAGSPGVRLESSFTFSNGLKQQPSTAAAVSTSSSEECLVPPPLPPHSGRPTQRAQQQRPPFESTDLPPRQAFAQPEQPVDRGFPVPQQPLYGEVRSGALAAARQRDSYAQSLSERAAGLYGRGSVLPPKARAHGYSGAQQHLDGGGALPWAAPLYPDTKQVAGEPLWTPPPVSRTPYELGRSHYDRLPQQQQQRELPRGTPWGAAIGSAHCPPHMTEGALSSGPGRLVAAATYQQRSHGNMQQPCLTAATVPHFQQPPLTPSSGLVQQQQQPNGRAVTNVQQQAAYRPPACSSPHQQSSGGPAVAGVPTNQSLYRPQLAGVPYQQPAYRPMASGLALQRPAYDHAAPPVGFSLNTQQSHYVARAAGIPLQPHAYEPVAQCISQQQQTYNLEQNRPVLLPTKQLGAEAAAPWQQRHEVAPQRTIASAVDTSHLSTGTAASLHPPWQQQQQQIGDSIGRSHHPTASAHSLAPAALSTPLYGSAAAMPSKVVSSLAASAAAPSSRQLAAAASSTGEGQAMFTGHPTSRVEQRDVMINAHCKYAETHVTARLTRPT